MAGSAPAPGRCFSKGRFRMHVIVCIKQVPESGNVRMDERTGTLVREGVENIVNPLDLYAIELGLRLKERCGGSVSVVSMGPRSAEKAVREAMAMGCDAGALVSHPAFAGSDTWATSFTLAAAVKKLAPFDLVLTGVRATDGETGQVGPALASLLRLPLCTYTSSVLSVGAGSITAERLVEGGYERLRLPLPCLLSVGMESCYPRLPTLRGKQRARTEPVPVWGPRELGIAEQRVGLKGSPTRVVKIERPVLGRKGKTIEVEKLGPGEAARRVAVFLQKRNLL